MNEETDKVPQSRPSSIWIVPSRQEAKLKVIAQGQADPLIEFVFDWGPRDGWKMWKADLEALLCFVDATVRQECAGREDGEDHHFQADEEEGAEWTQEVRRANEDPVSETGPCGPGAGSTPATGAEGGVSG